MNILITGAAGYIGKHLVDIALNRDINVTAVYRSDHGWEPKKTLGLSVIQDDIFSEGFFSKYDLSNIDACIHLAWSDGFKHYSDAHFNNLHHHIQFIKKLIDHGISHISSIGSMHEVGYHLGEVGEGEIYTNPTTPYGISKDMLRRYMMSLQEQKNIITQWLRVFYFYGDNTDTPSIFGKIIKAAQEGKKTFPLNTGEYLYDFSHINDICNQILDVVSQTEITGIINCCSGQPKSLKSMVEEFIRDRDINIHFEYGVFPERPYDSRAIWGSTEKIKKIQGLK